MPTDAPRSASRIAFDFTERQAFHANTREARVSWSIGSSVTCGRDGDAAGVRVLHDGDGGLVEVEHGAHGRVGVDVVVVAHLPAVQLLRLREPAARWVLPEGRRLVGVLAVAERRDREAERALHG